jgi:hypothetical protein
MSDRTIAAGVRNMKILFSLLLTGFSTALALVFARAEFLKNTIQPVPGAIKAGLKLRKRSIGACPKQSCGHHQSSGGFWGLHSWTKGSPVTAVQA